MANKHLDDNGLLYFWQKIKTLLTGKVDKVEGKALSTNDFTTDEKTKLAGLANTELVDNLTSTDTTKALTANQGKVLNDKINAITTDMGDLGAGDMMKATYDSDNSGVVDNAERLGGELPSYYVSTEQLENELSQVNKNISNGLDGKVDKVTGKDLSTNDFTNDLKTKLEGIEAGANKTVTDDTLNTTSTNPIQNKVVALKVTELEESLDTKASQTGMVAYVDQVGTTLQSTISGKAEQEWVEEELSNKAEASEVYTKLEIDGKTNLINNSITELETGLGNVYTKTEVDTKIADLVNSAPETLDTLGEIATALQENADVVDALNASIGNKVDKTDLVAITNAEIDTILAS